MSVSFKRRKSKMLRIALIPQASSLKSLQKKWDCSQIILPKKKKRKHKRRRKKKPNVVGKTRKCKFDETQIGILMKYSCRVEYDLLLSMVKETKLRITPELIEQLSFSSTNPMFKTRMFRIALLNFKVKGFVKYEKNLVEEELGLIIERLKERGLE